MCDNYYLSLTDMLKHKDGEFFISDWLRNKNTVEFLGIWENLNNPDFNYGEFTAIRNQAGSNHYKISVKEWVEKTNAKGLCAKAGRYGGTYAHPDIAFEFGTWISPEFKLYLIKEFQRLKEYESSHELKEWNVNRAIASFNFRILTDTVKEKLIPWSSFKQKPEWIIYAEEADLINIAVFGITAKQWRDKYPEEQHDCKTLRDCANTHQLIVLNNLENLSSYLIHNGVSDKQERLKILRADALKQLESLERLQIDPEKIQSPNRRRITERAKKLPEPIINPETSHMPFGDALKKISQAGKPTKEDK